MHARAQFVVLTGLALAILVSDGRPGAQAQGQNQLDMNHPMSFGMKDGRPALLGCSERIVEIPFVHRTLPYPFRGRLLDVGYRESEIIYEMASLGFDTWGIDIRPSVAEYPGVHYVQGDVIKYPFEAKSFDVVIALSTVEHIGLMAYGNSAKDPDGDLHSLQAIHRILKPTGRLLLTIPFGKRGATNWYRVYDQKALLALLKGSGFTAKPGAPSGFAERLGLYGGDPELLDAGGHSLGARAMAKGGANRFDHASREERGWRDGSPGTEARRTFNSFRRRSARSEWRIVFGRASCRAGRGNLSSGSTRELHAHPSHCGLCAVPSNSSVFLKGSN